jgi:hypothetical protein
MTVKNFGLSLLGLLIVTSNAISVASHPGTSILDNICMVERVDLLLGNATAITVNDHTFECFQLTDDNVYEIAFHDSQVEIQFREEFRDTVKYLRYDPSWIDPNGGVIRLSGVVRFESFTYRHLRDLATNFSAKANIGGMTDSEHVRILDRRLGSGLRFVTESNRNVIIVARITTDDAVPEKSIYEINEAIFGNNISFKQQMNDCSFGNINVRPLLPEQPVLDILVSKNITDYGYSPFFQVAEREIIKFLKQNNVTDVDVTDLHSVAEFFVLAVPIGLKPPAGTPSDRQVVAGSKHNSYKAVIVSTWINEPMVTLHEIG